MKQINVRKQVFGYDTLSYFTRRRGSIAPDSPPRVQALFGCASAAALFLCFANALRENSLGRFLNALALKEGDPMRQTDLAGADDSSFDDLSKQIRVHSMEELS